MRINRFEIVAFGPFSDKVLGFATEGNDLHILYGPNEAGKSSALRALKAWLFGFPERSKDDFLHPRDQLLVGGELSASEKTLTFFRRKRRKGDLIDSDHNPIDPALLTPFLGGLDLGLFEALYGIDHEALVRGGREILARQGEIGEALFSAGAGLGSLHRILDEMESEKKQLFLSRARNPRINQSIMVHKNLSREIRELSLLPEQWRELADSFDQVNSELAHANRERLELDRRRQHLERLHRALPLFSRKKKLLEQQLALGPHRPLPSDFSRQRSEAQQVLRRTGQRLEQAKARQTLLCARIDQLSPQRQFTEQQGRIEEIFQRLGEYHKARKDRPRLEGMRAVHIKEADRLLRILAPSLPLDKSDDLIPLVRRKRQILTLSSQYQSMLHAQKDADSRESGSRQRLEQIEKRLASMDPPEEPVRLKATVARARKAGDIDSRIQNLQQDCEKRRETINLRLRQLGRWQGDEQQLYTLKLPPRQTILLFRDEHEELEQQTALLGAQSLEIKEELLQLHTRQQELVYGGEPPSENELLSLRKRRDQGWQLICRSWLGQEDITEEAALYAPDAELSDTFYNLLLQTDSISDRLRLEADRVHGFAALRAKKEELEQRLDENLKRQRGISDDLDHHQEAWRILWQPLAITPGTPREMIDWHAEMEKLQNLSLELSDLRNGIMTLEKERDMLSQEIQSSCSAKELATYITAELEPLLAEAELYLENRQQAREAYQELLRDRERQAELVVQAENERKQLAGEMERWHRQWQQAAMLPGTTKPFEPDAAHDLLETVEQVFSTLKEATEFASRIQGIDRDCMQFEKDTEALSRDIAPDLLGQPISQCVQQLRDRLTIAGKEQTLRENYEKEVEELKEEIEETELVLADARQEMDKLLALAGCGKEEELARAEQTADDHKRLTEQLQLIDQDLQQIAGETSLDELSQEIEQLDPDSLPGELHALTMQITRELDPAIQALAVRKGEAGKMLEQMDGGESAARKEEELENNLARIRSDAEQYIRLQIGVDVLRQAIEEFRRRNQDPVLTIASRLFAELTLGSFSGLRTDVDDRGEPVLVGIRNDAKNTPLTVDAMSTGSRDQLYLSLRLASLQHRAINSHTMPFIVDDILINFDDERVAATLRVLAELGQQHQIILFSHHQQITRQAQTLKNVQIHHLNMAS